MATMKPRINTVLFSLILSSLWLLVWSLTHGFFMNDNLMSLLPGDFDQKYITASLYILIIIIGSFFILPKIRRKNLPKSKLIYLYLIPLSLIAALPFHYSLTLNPAVYILMILISCFWQDYLTFGIYQTELSKRLRPLATILTVATVFFLGHFIFYLDILNQQSIFSWSIIAIAGLALATIRYKTNNVYTSNVIHLSFLLLVV